MKKRRKSRSEKGITLLALVVTIIIMLILVGTTINLVAGGEGLFSRAKEATEKYKEAAAKENEELQRLLNMLDNQGVGDSSQLKDNTKDTPAGTIVNPPAGSKWKETSIKRVTLASGAEKIETGEAKVYAVALGEGVSVPVPVGFWYVGGDLQTGVVISDNENDRNKGLESGNTWTVADDVSQEKAHNKAVELEGNQFVWIPCDTYEKVDWGEGTVNRYSNARWDKSTNNAEKSQIEKYGGFYIGRYEAGTGEDGKAVKFSDNKDFSGTIGVETTINGWGWQNDDYAAGNLTYYGNKYVSGNITSKANQIPYFHSDYYTAVEMSEKMYKGSSKSTYINSGLVTGTQWDKMLQYIAKNVEGASAYVGDVTSSNGWGNYNNVTLSNLRGKYTTIDTSTGSMTAEWTSSSGLTNTERTSDSPYYLLTTGSTNAVQKKHIYDVSGNLWEWTEEACWYANGTNNTAFNYKNDDTLSTFMLRGGSFGNSYLGNPACSRNRYCAADTSTHRSFRVALYMK